MDLFQLLDFDQIKWHSGKPKIIAGFLVSSFRVRGQQVGMSRLHPTFDFLASYYSPKSCKAILPQVALASHCREPMVLLDIEIFPGANYNFCGV